MILTKTLEQAEREKYWHEFAQNLYRIGFWLASVVTAFIWGALS